MSTHSTNFSPKIMKVQSSILDAIWEYNSIQYYRDYLLLFIDIYIEYKIR
jgi:hypothetical protein